MKMKPSSVIILGRWYAIAYVDNPAEVDMYKRQSLWGQIDYWTRTIRIYDAGRPIEDITETLLHEILHGIAEELHLKSFKNAANHDELDLLALALSDVLFRNEWIRKLK